MKLLLKNGNSKTYAKPEVQVTDIQIKEKGIKTRQCS